MENKMGNKNKPPGTASTVIHATHNLFLPELVLVHQVPPAVYLLCLLLESGTLYTSTDFYWGPCYLEVLDPEYPRPVLSNCGTEGHVFKTRPL